MWDFLTFQTFITQNILLILYYAGAILIPIALWYFRYHLRKHFSIFTQIDTVLKQLFSMLSTKNRMLALLGFLAMFLCMELCWRIMFEVMIGYFDMHDYLHTIANAQALI